jgi:hypothetical protein
MVSFMGCPGKKHMGSWCAIRFLIAQINGRDEISIEEKVGLEKEYLRRRSLWFDFRIVVMTFIRVLKVDGVKH